MLRAIGPTPYFQSSLSLLNISLNIYFNISLNIMQITCNNMFMRC